MKNNVFPRFLPVFSAVVFCSSLAWSDLATDSEQTLKWFGTEIGDLMAFQAASTHFLPGDTIGFPGAEVGIAGSVSAKKLDVDGFRGLSFDTLDNKGSQIDLPTTIAAPLGVIHAKVGLPGGWDVGLKTGSASLDSTDGNAKFEFDNKVFGVEIRKRVLGGGLTGVALPDLAVSVGYDRASGDIMRTEQYNGDVLSGGTLQANTTWKSEWDVAAVTARAVVSKKIIFFTPFAGLGLTRTMGETEGSVDVNVTGGTSGLVSTSVKGKVKTEETISHVVVGAELSPFPFARLNVSGLFAQEHWSASVGLRVQFP
jgi:hypothetical protein